MNDVNNNKADLTIKDISKGSTESYPTSDEPADVSVVFELLRETFDRVQCLQRAILVMCEGHHDFKTEHARDMAELKRKLQDLGRNKVWIPMERI